MTMSTLAAETWCGFCDWEGAHKELVFKANPDLRLYGFLPNPRVGHCPECGKLAMCAPPPDDVPVRGELVA